MLHVEARPCRVRPSRSIHVEATLVTEDSVEEAPGGSDDEERRDDDAACVENLGDAKGHWIVRVAAALMDVEEDVVVSQQPCVLRLGPLGRLLSRQIQGLDALDTLQECRQASGELTVHHYYYYATT